MEPVRTVIFSVKSLSNEIKRYLDRNIKCHDETVTGMQHGIIGFVRSRGREQDVFQKDIEAQFHIRRSTATGMLQLMEKNGLLRREPVIQDARLKKIVLTEKALAVQQDAHQDLLRMEAELVKGVSPQALDNFFDVIGKIVHNIHESDQREQEDNE